MNTNASTSTSASNASSRDARESARQTDPHTLRREGDRFERLLREKSTAHEDDDDAQPIAPAAEGAVPMPIVGIGQPLQGHVAAQAALARAGAAAGDTASATQAALGSAMASQAPQQAQANGADAQTFQVSINEPMGLPLELRAVRVPAAGDVQAPALWALNIAAPSRDAVQLARHGSRLDERLRARGIDSAHVRIDDRRDQEDEQ